MIRLNNPKLTMLISLVIFTIALIWHSTCHAYTAIITWTNVSGDVAGYTLYESNNGRYYKKKISLGPNATRIELHNLSKYISVYWYLVSFDAVGNQSLKSNVVKYIR